MLPLDRDDGAALLALARAAIAAALGLGPSPPDEPPAARPTLAQAAAAFVTLREAGELRGCIGTLDDSQPVWRSVAVAAVSAALGDPRFPPLDAAELAAVELHVSILDRPEPLPDAAAFDPAVDGVIVTRGPRRGLLLPGVGSELGWDGPRTLAAACAKAGLAGDAWRWPGTRLEVFRSIAFAEPVAAEQAAAGRANARRTAASAS
ncbi:MAG TPA: AmmeMemoRadiSam system protein A [Candidatus Limnocylindrales bacterium]